MAAPVPVSRPRQLRMQVDSIDESQALRCKELFCQETFTIEPVESNGGGVCLECLLLLL